jgi:hypothetical protein
VARFGTPRSFLEKTMMSPPGGWGWQRHPWNFRRSSHASPADGPRRSEGWAGMLKAEVRGTNLSIQLLGFEEKGEPGLPRD